MYAKLRRLFRQALKDANTEMADLDGIAYTKGPGLIGALFVGARVGRLTGSAWDKLAIGVHHMEGHRWRLCSKMTRLSSLWPYWSLVLFYAG